MDKNVCGIYKITSPSGKIYIGQTQSIYIRWNVYKNLNCNGQKILIRSFKKYGIKNHNFEIIETCPKEHLNYYEIYYIWLFETYNTRHGMNCTLGGGGVRGIKWSKKSKENASKNRKGKYLKEKNPFWGKHHTAESLKLIGEKSINRFPSRKTKSKISKSIKIAMKIGDFKEKQSKGLIASWIKRKEPKRYEIELKNRCHPRKKYKSKNKYKGIYFENKKKLYRVVLYLGNKKNIKGGRFKNIIDAINKYNELAIKYIGEKAYLNKIHKY